MSEMVNFPRYGAYQNQIRLERAEAFINAYCKLSGRVNALLVHVIKTAPEIDALTIRHASSKASA